MLVLTRKVGEQIRIGADVVVTLVRIQGDKVRLGIEAPREVIIHREEVRRRLEASSPTRRPVGPSGGS
jgi:carbon storage regulator